MAATTAEVLAADISFKAAATTRDVEGNQAAVGTLTFMNEKVEITGIYSILDMSASAQERQATIINERNIKLTGQVRMLACILVHIIAHHGLHTCKRLKPPLLVSIGHAL